MRNQFIGLLLLAFIAACALPALAADMPASEDSAKKDEPVVATMGDDGVQHIDVVGGEYYYQPKHIVVKVNHPVELRVKKAGGFIPHNIIVQAPEAGIDFKVELKNEFQTISFTPTKTGKYEMYCDHRFLWFANHKEKGMDGMIEVVD